MKTILLFLLTLAGGFSARAQSATETTLAKNYWGIRQGFSPVSYYRTNDYLLALPKNMNMQYDFVYGIRLNRSFYFETGLTYHQVQYPLDFYNVNYNGVVREYNSYSIHSFAIPLGIRYRTSGEKWRFTANATALALGASLRHSRLYGVNQAGRVIQSEQNLSGGLGTNLLMTFGTGLEYQLAPKWTFRGEVNLQLSSSLLSPNPYYSPSFHFGLFKSIGKGKIF